jgi:hypothetical protein
MGGPATPPPQPITPPPMPMYQGPAAPPPPPPPPPDDPVLVGAGDIASGNSGDSQTAALVEGIPGTVFTLGDNDQGNGTAAEFAAYYDPTWGRFKDRTLLPALGNHEYNTPGAAGYFGYFGAVAGDPDKGYYSKDIGTWHIVVLNANCWAVNCAPDSPQVTWLKADLAANPTACTLAIWHEPLFTSGPHGPYTAAKPFWQALYDANADLVLNGHEHHYERFAPMAPSGAADSSRGMRESIVGTGGYSLVPFPSTIAPNSVYRNDTSKGVLKLTLHATSYDWQFVRAGGTNTDDGSGTCHCPRGGATCTTTTRPSRNAPTARGSGSRPTTRARALTKQGASGRGLAGRRAPGRAPPGCRGARTARARPAGRRGPTPRRRAGDARGRAPPGPARRPAWRPRPPSTRA